MLDVAPEHRTTKCPYCASPQVVERPSSQDRPNPTFVLAFVIPEARAKEIAEKWVRGRWLAPSAFRDAPIADTRGVYLPSYLYTASAHTTFNASIGENYQETETYTTTDSEGKTVTRTRTVTKTEWRSLSGSHAEYVSDIFVTASRGIPNAELEAIEPFDLRALHRYTPKVVSGWIAEEPSISPEACMQEAQQEALTEIGRRLSRFMPGDSHRGLQYQTVLREQNAVLTLVPVWVLAVRYAEDESPVRLLVNGQTGKLYGDRPLSWVKVTLLVLLAIALVVGGYFLLAEAL
jgi:hypothetical protein